MNTTLAASIGNMLAEAIRKYFRVAVEGLENVPREGGALIIPNHSGYAAADAIMIRHLLHHELGRSPKILAHRAFFDAFNLERRLSEHFGLEKVSVFNGIRLLQNGELVLIFPEGESGNFKPSTKRYHLQKFHTGFARMALETRAPIVPCIVVGAEESHLNLGSVDLSRFSKGLRLPIPVNLFPFPAKWKIKFLAPIWPDEHKSVVEIVNEFQIMMQHELNKAKGIRIFENNIHAIGARGVHGRQDAQSKPAL